MLWPVKARNFPTCEYSAFAYSQRTWPKGYTAKSVEATHRCTQVSPTDIINDAIFNITNNTPLREVAGTVDSYIYLQRF